MNTIHSGQSIAHPQPTDNATVQQWVDWFCDSFFPVWIQHARDPEGFGFYDLLDDNARPLQQDRRTVLAQARLLFTFSHLALITRNTAFCDAANVARDALHAFHKEPGRYSRARSASKNLTYDASDDLALSYDQSFVILGLSTWSQLDAANNVQTELEACWSAIENSLTDNKTGLLLEHDGLSNPADKSSPCRAQNPHMHLYEAALQAYEMTSQPVWTVSYTHLTLPTKA